MQGNLAAFMSGGKPFALERLIAIFESILDSHRSPSIGTTSILSSVNSSSLSLLLPPLPLFLPYSLLIVSLSVVLSELGSDVVEFEIVIESEWDRG